MPAFWVGLAWFLGTWSTKLIYRIAAAIGISFTTYTGITWVLDELETKVQGAFGGMTQTMIDAVNLLQLDKGMSVILSAYAVVAFLQASRLVMTKVTQ